MRSGTIAFLLGILSINFFSSLSLWPFYSAIISVVCFLYSILINRFKNITVYIAIYFFGLFWAAIFSSHIQRENLPLALDNHLILAEGVIASIPELTSFGIRFDFKISKYHFLTTVFNKEMLAQVVWMGSRLPLQAGEHWQLQLKLKRPHGFANSGSTNYESWLFSHGINATGYVLNRGNNKLLEQDKYHYYLTQKRQYIATEIDQQLKDNHFTGVIKALAIGDQSGITPQQWQIFSNTGTNHLVVIGGLHIAMCTGVIFWIVSFFWRRSKYLSLFVPAPVAATFAAVAVALLYSMLAGFSIPTQRAFIMLSIFLLGTFFQRNILPWQAYSFALFVILLLNPLATLESGFWLSFAAVAIITYVVSNRIKISGKIAKILHIQVAIGLGLMPFTLYFFQRAALDALIANSLSIPFFGFLIEPLSLLGALALTIHLSFSSYILKLAAWLLELFWPLLNWLATRQDLIWHGYIPNIFVLFSLVLGILLLLAPKGWPSRWLGFIFCLPLLTYKPPIPKAGELWITLLDVGQGLAVVIRTESHTLIYDTGPKFSPTFDAGTSVIIPYLNSQGIHYIDKMVISHGDNDHIGGADSILHSLKVHEIETSVSDRFRNYPVQRCQQGHFWRWDHVQFTYLYPPLQMRNLDNNSSCVLSINDGVHRILLTGDIEKSAENYLLKNERAALGADILIAPHHGSKTSSSLDFIQAIKPAYVLFATGYDNRYHFPNPTVIERYITNHAKIFNTVFSGAITFNIQLSKNISPPRQYRIENKHFWEN